MAGLQWNVESTGDLVAVHSALRPEIIRLCNRGNGEWLAVFAGEDFANGSLVDCIKASQRHVRDAARDLKIASLQRQLNQIERSSGGNWRGIYRAVRVRGQLDKLRGCRE